MTSRWARLADSGCLGQVATHRERGRVPCLRGETLPFDNGIVENYIEASGSLSLASHRAQNALSHVSEDYRRGSEQSESQSGTQ